MKKLSKTETLKTFPRLKGQGRLTHPYVLKIGAEILRLKLGESLLCGANEWQLSGPPQASPFNSYLKRINSSIKVGVKSMRERKQFIIVRIK